MENNLKQLLDCARGVNIPTEFENQSIDYDAALRDELKRLMGTRHQFERNAPEVFEILEQTAEEILPRKVIDLIGMFAEVKQFGNKDRLIFKKKKGRERGKQYVTRATAAGVYETFRLDQEQFEVTPVAYGAAGIMDFERYLDGDENILEIYDIILEGLAERIYQEIQGMLLATWNDSGRPSVNKAASNGFDAAKMAKLISVVSAYGTPVIYCGHEFAAQMSNVMTDGVHYWKVSDRDADEVRENGYIGKFAGASIVVMPNSFTDETNSRMIFNPRFAYVIPAGKEKIVKIAMVGDSHMRYVDNEDWSTEVQFYKKLGMAIVTEPYYWGIYYNSAIEDGGWDNDKILNP